MVRAHELYFLSKAPAIMCPALRPCHSPSETSQVKGDTYGQTRSRAADDH